MRMLRAIHLRRGACWPATLALATAIAAACGSGGDAGVDLPALEIRTSTTGTELDTDGYTVGVDGSAPQAIGLVDTVTVDPLADGPHTVTLAGLADNCAAEGGPTVTATVTAAATATVTYAIVCGPTHGRIVVTTTTAGESQDPDGYQVQLDETGEGPIGITDSLPINGVSAGNHQVTLGGVAANCSVAGDNPRTVTVSPGGVDTAAFAVSCVAPVGQVRVAVVSSGTPADPDGYSVSLDGGNPAPIATTDTLDLDGVAIGTHTVALGGLAANCAVQSANPVQVDVPLGGSVTAAFTVSCLGQSQVIAFTGNAPGVLAVFVVSPDGSGQSNLTPDTLLERVPMWSPDGHRLLVTRLAPSFDAETLYVMNGDGSGRTPLAGGPAIFDYRWSPDGSRIAFSLGRAVTGGLASDLWVMAADGSGKLKLASNAESPTWSPDGSLIAYAHDVANFHIRVIGATGTGDHRLTADSINAIQPAWSPDGSLIAFTSLNPNQIRVIHPDGSGLLTFTNAGAQEDGAVWSPDGSRLAFNSGPDNQPLESDVILINPDGSGRTNITNRPGFDHTPDWSPDGRQIVFSRDDNGDNEIYVMNSDGSSPVNVSNRPNSFESGPDWGGQTVGAMRGPLAGVSTVAGRYLKTSRR